MTTTETSESLTLELLRQMNRRLELLEDAAQTSNEDFKAWVLRNDRRMDRMDERLSARIDQQGEVLTGRIDQLDHKIDQQGEVLTGRIDQLDHKIDQQGEVLTGRIDQLDERLSARMDRLDHKIDRHFYWMIGILLTGGTAILGLLVRLSWQ